MNTLPTLLALFIAVPALAQTAAPNETLRLRVNNVTEPDQHFEIYCQDAACELMRFQVTYGDKVQNKIISHSELEHRAEMKLVRMPHGQSFNGPYYPYKGTGRILKSARQRWNGGFYGAAIREYLFTIVSITGETIALPATPITYYSSTYAPEKTKKKSSARTLRYLNALHEDDTVLNLRTKQYGDFLNGGLY